MNSQSKPEALFNQILEAIQSNKLPLPSKPDIVNAIQEISSNPNVNVKELTDVISQDPALTARLMRLANSPIVRGKVAVNSLDTAINRMGIAFVCNLATGLALEQLFHSSNNNIKNRINHVWEHCTQVAGVCSAIAQHVKTIAADIAMLAGLLHEIGTLSILSFAENHKELLEDTETFDILMQNYTAKLSKDIMRAWQFPAELVTLPEALNNYYDNKPQADLADALLLAKLEVLKGENHPLNELNRNELPCFQRLNFDPNKSLEDYPDLQEALLAAKDIFK